MLQATACDKLVAPNAMNKAKSSYTDNNSSLSARSRRQKDCVSHSASPLASPSVTRLPFLHPLVPYGLAPSLSHSSAYTDLIFRSSNTK
jgi:hypothetical protein